MLNLNNPGTLQDKERIDREAWLKHARSNTIDQGDFLDHKINKLSAAKKFLDKVNKYKEIFSSSTSIIELGGGSCWASYIVKKLFPEAKVVGTDIAEAAIDSHKLWEPVINCKLDDVCSCTSYDIPFPDASFDLVFCFESAHHFGKHKRTLEEIKRILKPNGYALYLCEPGCRNYIYPLAHKRVNNKRGQVAEDVLVYRNIVSLAESAGLESQVIFAPSLIDRGPKETLYYYVMNVFPLLQQFLPCTVDFKFRKP
ncbi:MAG: class I SAM-dependent methyltransferase [Cyanobacteria bacterium P01_A01_bin.40]